MRSVCGLVLALCLAAAARADEDAGLDFEFQRAANEGKVSVPEMLRRLQFALPHLAEPTAGGLLNFAEIYATAIKKANGAEFVELESMLRAMPADSLYFDECFSAYATARIREQVVELARKPVHLEWKPNAEPMPKELADAPASFRDAWKLHQTVIAPYRAVVDSPEKADIPLKRVLALDANLRRVVGKSEPEAWKHLAENRWVGWCGTGSEVLYHPRNRALLLSFLADGKLREAAGAALMQIPGTYTGSDGNPMDSLTIDLFTAFGLDWEQVLFGSLLPVKAFDMADGQPVIAGGQECDPWRLLATRGSERAVRQCLELIRWTRLEPRNAEEFLATALGPEPARPGEIMRSTDTFPVRAMTLPPELRREVIAVFAGYLVPTNSPSALIHAMQEVPTGCVKDLREPLGALLSHRVHAVGARALQLLAGAGLATGQEKIAPAPPPLRFRLLLNGKPLVGEKISVSADVSPEERARKPLFYDLAPRQDLTTDANGGISYSLEECLEPERIGSVEFRAVPDLSSIEADDERLSVSISETPRERDNEWPGPWLVRQIEVRAGDEQLHEVDLHAAELEVKITSFDPIASGIPAKILLRRGSSPPSMGADEGVAKVTAKLGSSAFFRRLQPGEYTLVVKASGAARYESKAITVGDAGVVHEVKLEPGRNARGTAIYPDGTKTSLASVARLFRDGVEIPREGMDEWKALAFGKYTAHIASTREDDEEAKKAGVPVEKVAPEDRIAAREVDFVIDASTPPTLDLGEILVPREKR